MPESRRSRLLMGHDQDRPVPTSAEPGRNDPRSIDAAPTAPIAPSPDPFDPARLRMDQDFGAKVGVKKLLTTVPVRKPGREAFVRTHPDPAYRLLTGVVELKEEREIYLVAPVLWDDLATESTFGPRML